MTYAEIVTAVPSGAVYVQPIRIVRDQIRTYTALTWKGGFLWFLNRLNALGMLTDDGKGCQIDLLDADGCIVGEMPLTLNGLKYFYRTQKLRWENRDESITPGPGGARDGE